MPSPPARAPLASIKKSIDIRHLLIKVGEYIGERTTGGKGRGLLRRAAPLGRGVTKLNGKIDRQEQLPASPLGNRHEEPRRGRSSQQLARPGNGNPQLPGNRLRREQRLMSYQSQKFR